MINCLAVFVVLNLATAKKGRTLFSAVSVHLLRSDCESNAKSKEFSRQYFVRQSLLAGLWTLASIYADSDELCSSGSVELCW